MAHHREGCNCLACVTEKRDRQRREWMSVRYPDDDAGMLIYDEETASGGWRIRLAEQWEWEEARRRHEQSHSEACKIPDRNIPTRKTPASTNVTEDTAVSHDRIIQEADAAVKAEIAKRETDRITAEKIALVDAYGEDTFADGTVVRFKKKHNKNGTDYTYTAVRYTSGDESYWHSSSTEDGNSTRTWGQLVEFLVSGPFPVVSFDVMTVESTYPTNTPAATPNADPKA